MAGGQGRFPGSPTDWRKCLAAYGLTEVEALAYPGNPVDNLRPLAEAGIPLLHVCGAADEGVPFEENTQIVEQRYRALGGTITVLAKPFGRHHPHSLKEPASIVDFIVRHTGPGAAGARPPAGPFGYDYFVLRGGLPNCRLRFERQGFGRVAFLGGSITAGRGWRDMVCADLQRRFPRTRFEFINAGIPSLGSVPGAFRFRRDVLGAGPVDLLFVEAAVNDEVNGQSDPQQIRGMEGIVRQARLAEPAMDVVLLHFADPAKLEVVRRGATPAVIANHERVADRYRAPSLDLAQEVAERIAAGEFTWEEDFVDLHPSEFGHRLYARSVGRMLDAAWAGPLPVEAAVRPHPLPEPVDVANYSAGRLVDPTHAGAGNGWTVIPDWTPADRAATRPGFVNVPVLVAEDPGATLTFSFEGTAVGIFVVSGPDAGRVDAWVDGALAGTRDLYTQWSRSLHLPWAQVLAAGLPPGGHELKLRIAREAHPHSAGHAMRIVHFLVNGAPST